MIPHRKYCILFHRMKSGKLHRNTWRCSSQILEGHSICPFDLHQLIEQCLIHYDDNTKCWLVFWPHAFTSTQPHSIIQIMCKYDKANTNTCHVMWLVRVVFFEDCPASLIVFFTLSLKKKAMFCAKALAADLFSSTFMNCWLFTIDFTIDFEEAFIQNPSNQKRKPLVSPVEPASRTSPVEPAWRLRFVDGFKSICAACSMGNVFIVQIWIIDISSVACKMCQ